jgi:hypothetical protein
MFHNFKLVIFSSLFCLLVSGVLAQDRSYILEDAFLEQAGPEWKEIAPSVYQRKDPDGSTRQRGFGRDSLIYLIENLQAELDILTENSEEDNPWVQSREEDLIQNIKAIRMAMQEDPQTAVGCGISDVYVYADATCFYANSSAYFMGFSPCPTVSAGATASTPCGSCSDVRSVSCYDSVSSYFRCVGGTGNYSAQAWLSNSACGLSAWDYDSTYCSGDPQ